MQNAELYPRYRYVMGVLDILCSNLTHMVCLAIAPMLIYIAADFNIDTATAGYATTLHILAQGLFMLIGPIIIGYVDHKKTQFAGVSLMVLGTVCIYFAPNFPMLLVARFLTGAGHGISSACTHSIIAAWFPPKQKSAMVTANSLGIVLITFLTYTFTVPFYKGVGNSWRLVLLIMGGVLLVLDVCWILFARDNHVLNEYIKRENALQGKQVNAFTGMKEALSRKDVLLLGVFMGFSTIAANGISTYMPQFLNTVRGFSEEAASSIVGVASGISAVATFLGGFATTALGKRKIIIIPSYILSMSFLVLALSFSGAGAISGMFIAYTIFNNMRTPASQTISTELKNVTPQLTSSAAAIAFGIGFIGTFFTSPLLKLSIALFGEANQMLIYIPLFVISFIAILLMPETGPGRKAKA